jgi:DNA-binding CsgD family transcriptional regulator
MKDKFFFSKNKIDGVSDTDFRQLSDYQWVLNAFDRTIYSSVYVIDYEKQTFEYVSENPLFLCGYSAAEVKQMGYDFYMKNVPEEDLDLLIKINRVGFEFFESLPVAEKRLCTISYDFHLKSEVNKKVLIHHKLTPVFLTESGRLWKAICVVTLSTQKTAGNIIISLNGTQRVYSFDLTENCWKQQEIMVLSEREREILQLSIRGFTMSEIAKEIFLSPETVKFHRKKIFNKMGVTNIAEAIFYAANNKLL